MARLLALLCLLLPAGARADSRAELEAASRRFGVAAVETAAKAPAGVPASSGEPGLYFRRVKVTPDRWLEHRAALDELTERFLAEVVPPFVLPAGRVIVTGTDDLAYGHDRGGRLVVELTPEERRNLVAPFTVRQPHEALDVGSRVSADGGRTLETLRDAVVHPIHPRGAMEKRHDGLYAAQRVRLEQGPYLLVLDVIYAHVAPAAGRLGTDRPVGRLHGNDRWDVSDPALAAKLPYKGNHLHLLIRGVNDLEKRHYAELSRPGRRDPALTAYVDYRADFYNRRLLPKVTGGR